MLWEGSASSLDVVLPGASEATGLLFDFSVGDRRIGTGVCAPSQGTNSVCAWGLGKDGLTMCRCVFTLSGDRVSWVFGGSNYYAFRTTLGQPLTFIDGGASVVTRISRV